MRIRWGTRESVGRIAGFFYCPKCKTKAPYRVIRLMKYTGIGFLFWTSDRDTKTLATYIRCDGCRERFEEVVLSSLIQAPLEASAPPRMEWPVPPGVVEGIGPMLDKIVAIIEARFKGNDPIPNRFTGFVSLDEIHSTVQDVVRGDLIYEDFQNQLLLYGPLSRILQEKGYVIGASADSMGKP
jgi:hypothetical protein